MSVRVNLLPEEVSARGAANRSRVLGVLAVVLLLAVLGVLTLLQRSAISDAEERLAVAEARSAELNADVAALQPFADLEARSNDAVEVVRTALGAEGSFATILQDLSTVMPPNAEFTSVNITFSGDPVTPAPGGDRLVYGQLTAAGRVLDGVAPGVERLIIDLDRVAAFDNAFVQSSVVDDEGVVSFSVDVQLGPEALTGRYAVRAGGGQ